MKPSPLLIEKIVKNALMEDLGHGFDITSDTVIGENVTATAELVSQSDGILAGIDIGLAAFSIIDKNLKIEKFKQDASPIKKGDKIAIIKGNAKSILTAERTALNFITHLCGVATLTNKFVKKTKGTKAHVTCTRKTLPGLKTFQKYAVLCGGGKNHRYGLDDAILIKDNHIEIAGGINQALDAAKDKASHMTKIEIEVDSTEQLKEVLKNGKADIVMLDNFPIDEITAAIKIINGRLLTEVSGGVNLDTVKEIAKTGVDIISVGALTHSVVSLDIGLDIDINK